MCRHKECQTHSRRWCRRRCQRPQRRHSFGFRSIIFEGMHPFHSQFTEAKNIVKYEPSSNVESICKTLLSYGVFLTSVLFFGLNIGFRVLTGRSRRCFFCGPFMLFLSCVCYAFLHVCLLMPCGHLQGKS